MSFLFYFSIFLISFLIMEFVAWWVHKYVMHGFLWCLHKSHHSSHKGFFEKNDWFVVFFALPAFSLTFFGFIFWDLVLASIDLGITVYGVMYFIFHDWYVHKRFWLPKNFKFKLFEKLRRLHNIHHGKKGKDGCSNFGFLWGGFGD